ncbi:MAG: class I SAM-dependent methyltransferase [bacterium]|nr:class I SAM-dependent methyltransferase [bacterium]
MAFADPLATIKEFSLDEGMHVADFGAGSGAYAIPMARRVGSGRVYAVDVQKDLLETVKREAARERVHNIEIVWGDIEEPKGSKLADRSVDRVLVSNILFQTEHKEQIAKEAARILRPNGLCLVIEWSGSYGGLGPKEAAVVRPADARRIFLNNGFAEAKEVSAGEYHYGILFRRL